jgi:hypothetical protein
MDTCHNLEETSDPPSNFLWSTFGDIRRCNSRDSSNPVTGQHSSSVNQTQTVGWSAGDGGEDLHARVRRVSAILGNSEPTAPTENIKLKPRSVYLRPIFAIFARSQSTPLISTHKKGIKGSALSFSSSEEEPVESAENTPDCREHGCEPKRGEANTHMRQGHC